jgi:toxin CptA
MLVQNIPVSPSVRLAVALCAVHLAAAILLWLLPVAVLLKGAATLAIAFSLVYFLARDATLHAAKAVVELELKDGGGIAFRTREGSWVESELAASSYVSPALTIVVLRPRGKAGTRRVVLLPDSVDARDFRRLRMWMRWKHEGGATQPLPEC